jgi:polysaccharide export outer membrane protein
MSSYLRILMPPSNLPTSRRSLRKVAFALTLAQLFAVVGGGCAPATVIPKTSESEPYRIGREDVLDVAVWRDPDLSRSIPVRPDGLISLPIVGEVQAAGKTPSELESSIRNRLEPYLKDPKVTVIVREANSSRVFVTGQVQRPGAYPIKGRVSVVQAIALAGGFAEFANSNALVVIREGKGGGRFPVRYNDLVHGSGGNFYLQPGDTVVVP